MCHVSWPSLGFDSLFFDGFIIRRYIRVYDTIRGWMDGWMGVHCFVFACNGPMDHSYRLAVGSSIRGVLVCAPVPAYLIRYIPAVLRPSQLPVRTQI